MTYHQKNLLAFADFFIPCAPEAQITHKFVLGPQGGDHSHDLGQKELNGEGRGLLNSTSEIFAYIYLSEKCSLLDPFMCPIDTSTTLPVHCSEFTL